MRKREPWQHEWGKRSEYTNLKRCERQGCRWEMLSRKNSNRYRNGPDGEWKHSPKDCEGEQK